MQLSFILIKQDFFFFWCGFFCFVLNQKTVKVKLLWKRLWKRLQAEINLQLIYKVSTLLQKSIIFFFLKLILTFLSNYFHMKKMWVPTVIYSVKKELKTVQKQRQQNSPKHKRHTLNNSSVLFSHFCNLFLFKIVTKDLLLQIITVFHVQITHSITVIHPPKHVL